MLLFFGYLLAALLTLGGVVLTFFLLWGAIVFIIRLLDDAEHANRPPEKKAPLAGGAWGTCPECGGRLRLDYDRETLVCDTCEYEW